MNFQWEDRNERLKRYLELSPKKKLEWLYEINEFLNKFTPARIKKMKKMARAS